MLFLQYYRLPGKLNQKAKMAVLINLVLTGKPFHELKKSSRLLKNNNRMLTF